MFSSSSDGSKESLQFWQDDKFYSRLLSKESSLANPSYRVYYGVASGAVPFTWESQPGTPKHPISTAAIPPLTPPPSYFSKTTRKGAKKARATNNKPNLIRTILPRLALKKPSSPSSPPESSSSRSSSSSSSSSSFSPMSWPGAPQRDRGNSLGSLIILSRGEFEDYDDDRRPASSTLCFGAASGLRGGYCSVMTMKNALLSIVGHGSGQGTAA